MSAFLTQFDGLQSNTVFCVWTGTNPMSDARRRALWSLFVTTCCPVAFVSPNSIRDWERSDAPFHPAYEHLSATHKADYLRCYLMHHCGGGYADIKMTVKRWDGAFARLRESDSLALGYTEVGPQGVAPVEGALGDEMRRNWSALIGFCAFVFRRRTALTTAWLERVHAVLDREREALAAHPAQHAQDVQGLAFSDGTKSAYPLRWTELGGDIFHPLVWEYRARILHDDIAPSLEHAYR